MVRVRRPRPLPVCTISDEQHAINMAELTRRIAMRDRNCTYEEYYRSLLLRGWTDEAMHRLVCGDMPKSPALLIFWQRAREHALHEAGPEALAALADAHAAEREAEGGDLFLPRVDTYARGG